MARTRSDSGGAPGGGTVTSVDGVNSVVASPSPIVGAGTLQLSGDSAAPGTNRYYGTDGTGTKGWYALPSGQAGIQFQDEGLNLGTSATVTTIDFVGAGVVASRIGNTLTVSISNAGTITGSGVATRLAYWDTASSITSDANLFWDPGNEFLGIGIPSPLYNADIAGTGINAGDPNNPDAIVGIHNIGSGAENLETGIAFFGSDSSGNTDVYGARIYHQRDGVAPEAARLTLQTTNSGATFDNVLSVKNNRVGIQTINPGFDLDVSGISSGTGIINAGNAAAFAQGFYYLQEVFFATQAVSTGTLLVGNGTATAGFGCTMVGVLAGRGTGIQNTFLGNGAGQSLTNGTNNSFFGFFAGSNVTTGISNTVVGTSQLAANNTSSSIAIGVGMTVASNQGIFGSVDGNGVTDWRFGKGASFATPQDISFSPTYGLGTNIAGADFALDGGPGTGNATPGTLQFRTATKVASGSGAQSLSVRATVSETAFAMTAFRFETVKGADVVAANDLTLGLDGNVFVITGNTQINAITTASWQEGSHITLKFTGTPTVKNNTAGGAGTALILLAGSADLVAADNTILGLVFVEGEWQETFRKVA